MTLGGLKTAFSQSFTGGYELADIKSAFQSEDLPTAYQTGSNTISNEQTPYELPEGAAPSPLNKELAGTEDLKSQTVRVQIGEASVPGTVRVSEMPKKALLPSLILLKKCALSVCAVKVLVMKAASVDLLLMSTMNGSKPNASESKVAPTKDSARNEICATFLNHKLASVKAITAANAVAGYWWQ